MRYDFSNVTDEQLSKLFPVLLEEHNPNWTEYYSKEQIFLASVFDDKMIRINHIGSSYVPGLISKPTIDILLEVSEDTNLVIITDILTHDGYIVNTPKYDLIMYIKGYTPKGFKGQAVHIHVRHSDDWGELYFRDYLRANPSIAQEYEKIKLSLKDKYTYDRDEYTKAKGNFVKLHTEKSREMFLNKYTPVK